MTLPRLKALGCAWRKHPPTHILLAAYLGHRPAPKARQGDLTELMALARVRAPA